MNKEGLLKYLCENADTDGRVQFNFSSDLSDKRSELEILKELENDRSIKQLTMALGYAIYQVL